MASARGVVTCTVAGVQRRLRLSLGAIADIEAETGASITTLIQELGDPERLRVGRVLVLYRALCAAGGTPLSDEDVAVLMPSDLPEIVDAIAATVAENSDESAKKKTTASRSRSRGAGGRS